MTIKAWSHKDLSALLGITQQGVSNLKRRVDWWPSPNITDHSGSVQLYTTSQVKQILNGRFPKNIADAIFDSIRE